MRSGAATAPLPAVILATQVAKLIEHFLVAKELSTESIFRRDTHCAVPLAKHCSRSYAQDKRSNGTSREASLVIVVVVAG